MVATIGPPAASILDTWAAASGCQASSFRRQSFTMALTAPPNSAGRPELSGFSSHRFRSLEPVWSYSLRQAVSSREVSSSMGTRGTFTKPDSMASISPKSEETHSNCSGSERAAVSIQSGVAEKSSTGCA